MNGRRAVAYVVAALFSCRPAGERPPDPPSWAEQCELEGGHVVSHREHVSGGIDFGVGGQPRMNVGGTRSVRIELCLTADGRVLGIR